MIRTAELSRERATAFRVEPSPSQPQRPLPPPEAVDALVLVFPKCGRKQTLPPIGRIVDDGGLSF